MWLIFVLPPLYSEVLAVIKFFHALTEECDLEGWYAVPNASKLVMPIYRRRRSDRKPANGRYSSRSIGVREALCVQWLVRRKAIDAYCFGSRKCRGISSGHLDVQLAALHLIIHRSKLYDNTNLTCALKMESRYIVRWTYFIGQHDGSYFRWDRSCLRHMLLWVITENLFRTRRVNQCNGHRIVD